MHDKDSCELSLSCMCGLCPPTRPYYAVNSQEYGLLQPGREADRLSGSCAEFPPRRRHVHSPGPPRIGTGTIRYWYYTHRHTVAGFGTGIAVQSADFDSVQCGQASNLGAWPCQTGHSQLAAYSNHLELATMIPIHFSHEILSHSLRRTQ
jgi:hypothetical protein